MNKKSQLELVKLLEQMTNGLDRTIDVQGRIIGLIKFLMNSIIVILFILGLLIWKEFLWDPFNTLISMITNKWSLLSEAYQIFILGFIGTIISSTISLILGSLILEKIKKILKK